MSEFSKAFKTQEYVNKEPELDPSMTQAEES